MRLDYYHYCYIVVQYNCMVLYVLSQNAVDEEKKTLTVLQVVNTKHRHNTAHKKKIQRQSACNTATTPTSTVWRESQQKLDWRSVRLCWEGRRCRNGSV